MFTTTPSASTTSLFRFTGATPSISASSPTTDGIVWALETGSHGTDHGAALAGPAVLHAFDATNIGTELWNSSTAPSDAAGNAVKFTVPTIANGKVYVPTRGNDDTEGGGTIFGEVDVYGLIP
jgi:outer membrane protein assembly factor BamB